MATRRSYTPEFKSEAVRLVFEQGLSIAQVGKDLGICKTVIREWVNKARDSGQAPAAPAASSIEEELRRLRRENAILREEREILKKAAAFFAKESR